MSKKFAIIENNKIANLIKADDAFIAAHKFDALDVTDMNPAPHIGYDVIDRVIQFPDNPVVAAVKASSWTQAKKTKIINKLNSGGEFTDKEKSDLLALLE